MASSDTDSPNAVGRDDAPQRGIDRDAGYDLGATNTPLPDYPWSARRRGSEGRVLIRLGVDPLGHAVSLEIVESSGDETLDQAACDTLRHWRLRPAMADGIPVATTIMVPIRFELRRDTRL